MSITLHDVFGGAASGGSRGTLLHRLNSAMALYRSRARLAELDAHLLDDIGLTRRDVEKEANRPLWDAPDGWKF